MRESNEDMRAHAVLGQKYAYATISLILGLLCFVNVAGMEKAIVAIVFGWLALKSEPAPKLKQRRLWAKFGIGLGLAILLLAPLLIYYFVGIEGLRQVFELLRKLDSGK